jgi:hypothetical protein
MAMTVIARDAVAADHLVYAWPFPIGPECEVSCADDEQVVMCPAWLVGDRLGPGHHHWRTPDPSRPVSAFFVLTAPVEVSFDVMTMFIIPSTGQGVRLRASGSLQVRCVDPGLLIAQFVGLPFDAVNDGILRSVSRSVERMLARLLTRRVVMAGSPIAVTDPGMLPGIIEELVAYNPTAGAVFGIELLRVGHLVVVCDDGSSPYLALPQDHEWSAGPPHTAPPNGDTHRNAAARLADRVGEISLLETARGRPGAITEKPVSPRPITQSSPELTLPPLPPLPPPATAAATQPGVHTPVPGTMTAPHPAAPPRDEPRGAIFGVGTSTIGHGAVAGEIAQKVPPGARVLVPGPNGLMQSATVRQLLQGYYELEVGHSGETIWVPIHNVVPEG